MQSCLPEENDAHVQRKTACWVIPPWNLIFKGSFTISKLRRFLISRSTYLPTCGHLVHKIGSFLGYFQPLNIYISLLRITFDYWTYLSKWQVLINRPVLEKFKISVSVTFTYVLQQRQHWKRFSILLHVRLDAKINGCSEVHGEIQVACIGTYLR